MVVLTGAFGNRQLVTPLVSQVPSFFAKVGSCLNPVVMMISHPKYRNALVDKCPWMGITKVEINDFVDEEEVKTEHANVA